MILSEGDLKSISLIYFSRIDYKLFDNEKVRKKVDGKWVTVKIGMPDGAPDQIGWKVGSGVFVGNEIKTINDRLSDDQRNFLNILVENGCHAFVTKQMNENTIKIKNWKTKKSEKIFIDDFMQSIRA